MSYGTSVEWEPLQRIQFSQITSSFTPVGVETKSRTRILGFKNLTDTSVILSQYGTDENIHLLPLEFKVFDLCSNKVRDDGMYLAKMTQFFIKHDGAAPTTGSVILEFVNTRER